MVGQPRGPAMDGPDPQMVQAVMHHFLQLLQGGMRSPSQGPMGGSLPMRAFANGGVVNQPTIGLLGEAGPEAVVPLQTQQGGPVDSGDPVAEDFKRRYAARHGQVYNPAPAGIPGTSGYGAIPWFLGGAQQAGFFGANPPQGILDSIRQRIIADNAAQARSARLGLMGNASIDPSTFGFQALMSDLQGQQNLQHGLSSADLALRQQQLDFLQKLLMQQAGFGAQQVLQREQPGQGFDWGGLAGGAGTLIGALK